MKKVDEAKLFAILDRILGNVRAHATNPVREIAASPSIESFVLTPIAQTSPTGNYRVSWEVKGAAVGKVWISSSCSGDLSIFEIGGPGAERSSFPCDVNQPAKAAAGSLGLEFRNMSGGETKVVVRLFAAGNPSLSRAVTISLPPLPVIISVSGGGERYVQGMPPTPFRMAAGRLFQIAGVGILPKETLWIGSMSIPVKTDGEIITFTSPTSLPAGQYPMFLANERGKSDVLMVELVK
jgi:hypothetical protein